MAAAGFCRHIFRKYNLKLTERLLFRARARFCEFAKRYGIEHNGRAVFEADPAARGPGAQLLVDALARHADHLADFLLGDRDGLTCGVELAPFSKAKQRTGEPA